MKTIQKKIIIYVVIAFLILFVLLLVTIDREMEKTTIPLSKNLTKQIVGARGDQITYWLEKRIENLEGIAYNIVYFNMDKEASIEYMKIIFKEKKQIYESFGIIDNNGVAWITDGSKFSVANREYYKRIIKEDKDFVISQPISSKSNQADIIVILYKIPNGNNVQYKYISAAVPITKINEIAKEIHLYDGKGEIEYNNETYTESEQINRKNAKKEFVKFETNIEKSPGWLLTFDVSSESLREGVRKVQHSALLIGILIGGVLLLILIFFSASIVNPIRNLQRLMKNVETGDLTVRFQEDRVDEIGQLGRSFNEMLDKLYKAQYEKREMELRLIQEQVKPHFLYNTLDTIQWMATDYGAEDVVELIEALGTYFRIGLSKGNKFITLSEELDHIESYLQIQKARYETALNYEIKYDENFINYKVIRIILQPIVENAIYHGIKKNPGKKCTIYINIFVENSDMYLIVKDNGIGIRDEKLVKLKNAIKNNNKCNEDIGFGLYSVNHRLKLAFGEKYGVDIDVRDGYTKVIIKCPLIKGSD